MGPESVHAAIAQHASATPVRTAVHAPDGSITYAELDAAAGAVATALAARDVAPGTPVGIRLTPSIDYITALLGTLQAGAAAMPLDPTLPRDRLAAMFESVVPALVLGRTGDSDDWREAVPQGMPAPDTIPIESLEPPPAAPAAPRLAPETTGYILFTSGSTGRPRAIAGRHAGLAHFIAWECRTFALGPDCRIPLLAPTTFDVSLRDIFAPLVAGGCLAIPGQADRAGIVRLLDWLESAGVTHMHCVPSLFRAMLADLPHRAAPALPSLRCVLLAGEPLFFEDVRRWRDLAGGDAELVNLYGPTETTLAVAACRIGDLDASSCTGIVPLGRPIDGAELLVLDGNRPCTPGETGMIHVRTDFPTNGYIGNGATGTGFIPNPVSGDPADRVFPTGDLGRRQADGNIAFVGRQDAQVKVNGVRIEPGDIEAALLAHRAVTHAAVTATGDGRLAAFVVLDADASAADLREHLLGRLPSNMIPSTIEPLDALPLNAHGKLDRAALARRQPAAPRTGKLQTETETALADLWRETLGVDEIAPDSSFLELGGDSLKAMQLIGQIYRAFAVEVTMADLLRHPTVGRLAEVVDSARAGAEVTAP